ncbi:MAG: exodeoxyribonuclease VII large subunit [Galactobacter sp.]|uniref:exodeoxyribonuclease VII large subunit n=1 Tax=Galactobacter sp. TaxID=2676125 RepID=UPI0025C26222|nr:exodeoxyribonuclease VII large subunit [Galactobacter sp.]
MSQEPQGLDPDGPDPARTLPPTAAATTPDNPWPLSLLAQNLKTHIERAPSTWIEGQLIEANLRKGAAYLTMRDLEVDNSLPVTIWANVLRNLPDQPEVGSRVVAQVKPSFWLKAGRLSMNATDLRPVGLGDLLARLERLRRQLAEEGLFNADRKRPLPFLPQRIGLITGRDSDAEKDVLRNAGLRWPEVAFEVRHTAVQGVHCVGEVTAAIQELDADATVDVIIIARGGGSLEDLLGFSDERVVRAVSAARTPVVSAIGHEADRPLLDDVADLRASTPTDAAKRVVPDVGEERAGIAEARHRLRQGLGRLLDRSAQDLNTLRSRPVLRDPYGMISTRDEDLTRLQVRGDYAVRQRVSRAEDEIAHLSARVRSLSPQQTLDRGYAVLQHEDGTVLREAEQAPEGTRVTARLARGLLALDSRGALPDQLRHQN